MCAIIPTASQRRGVQITESVEIMTRYLPIHHDLRSFQAEEVCIWILAFRLGPWKCGRKRAENYFRIEEASRRWSQWRTLKEFPQQCFFREKLEVFENDIPGQNIATKELPESSELERDIFEQRKWGSRDVKLALCNRADRGFDIESKEPSSQ